MVSLEQRHAGKSLHLRARATDRTVERVVPNALIGSVCVSTRSGRESVLGASRSTNLEEQCGRIYASRAWIASRAKIATTRFPPVSTSLRVYPHLLDPTEHPDYSRRAVRPPTWQTFEGRTQFTCLRAFEVKDGRIVGHEAEIEKYVRRHGLGRVIWPSYPVLFASNLGELADALVREGLYLFDIWGYVPGSGPGGYWLQFKAPAEALRLLESKLGDRWLGTDIGEQDGRYLNGYAGQMTPPSADRFEQYLNFQRHFERMGDDLGHRHATLVSLNFGHYFLKEGTYTLIGAETAQALPNNQVYYAFIRGAGKQHGVPWFGNASVFNRWGFKSYAAPGQTDGYPFGPTKGTSLSLLKRLLYTHLLYNGMLAGFETGWIEGDTLTPIGAVQQAANRWLAQHGPPGVMQTPVALLLDFHSGWSFPRHLYSEKVYRVWGNLPYGPGDFLTDAVLDLLFPGYQDSSYYHDESGFMAPTPFGDIADCLLTDAPGWVLDRYPVVVVAGELAGGREIRDTLDAYVASGGHLVITAGNLAKLPGGLGGITGATGPLGRAIGAGRLTVLDSAFGVQAAAVDGPLRSAVDAPLPKPFVLEPAVRETLSAIFRGQQLFAVEGSGLSVVTCRQGPGTYTVGIANNTWRESPWSIESRCGAIESVTELALDAAERGAEGFLPEGVDGSHLGVSGPATIAGGDIRIFRVQVREEGVVEIPRLPPPRRPAGRFLTLRHPRTIKTEILARPTFFRHCDGVVVDWRYVHDREAAALARESGWIRRQGLRVVVDFSSGLNLYPDLRLVNNLPEEAEASLAAMRSVLGKLATLGACDAILALHRLPENNFTAEQMDTALVDSLRALAATAEAADVTLHLRATADKSSYDLAALADLVVRVGSRRLKLAPALSLLLAGTTKPVDLPERLKAEIGLWLCAAPRFDHGGNFYDPHAPLAMLSATDRGSLGAWLALAPTAPKVLDGLLAGIDDEYLDAQVLAAAGG